MKEFLEIAEECKEHNCKINKKNIKTIYKTDKGIKKNIPNITNKLCDCIIECEDGKIVIVEILCGTLTYREYKDKLEQLKNCIKIVKFCKSSITKLEVIVLYKTLEYPKKSKTRIDKQAFMKKLISNKIENCYVKFYQSKNFNGAVC